MSFTLPNYIVHYSRSEAFKSILDTDRADLNNLINQMNDSNTWGHKRFYDPDYLNQRIEVEKKLRQEFINKGGRPELDHPIYFFLGNNSHFEKHPSNVGYKINLSDIPELSMSFTYGDSMISLCEDNRQKMISDYQDSLCLGVYLLNELESLSQQIVNKPNQLHIECQLWIKPSENIITRIGR